MSEYKIVQLRNGSRVVHSAAYGETMHPGLGPAAEADLLYVRQLKIPERIRSGAGEFVVWDVGLGAAANVIAVLRATREIARPLRLVSFDDTSAPLEFAVSHAAELEYFDHYETATRELLAKREIEFTDGARTVRWQFHLGDFPALLRDRVLKKLPAPDAILFDAFSPAKNPAMWTLPLFTNLFGALDPARPCNLTTYSRSTMFRVTLLLAGFFAGRGAATALKEETTVAANVMPLIDEPLDCRWLERARRSDSAEPLSDETYRRAALSPETFKRLKVHPQFSRNDTASKA